MFRQPVGLLPRVVVLQSTTRSKGTSKPVPEMGKTTYVYNNLPEPGGEFEEGEYLPRRLTYWPPDLKYKRGRKVKHWFPIKAYIDVELPEKVELPEWTEKPEYPEITDYKVFDILSREKKLRLEWYKKIRQMPTFVDKMMELTQVDRQFAISVKSWSEHYNNIFHYQNMTRTNLIHHLPDLYDQIDVSDIKSVVKDSILDAVTLSFNAKDLTERGRVRRPACEKMPKHMFPEVDKTEGLVMDLSNIALKGCVKRAPHLIEGQTDLYPEVQSFWYMRAMDLPTLHPRWSSPGGGRYPKSNTGVQFNDFAVLNIRTKQPLDPIVPQDSDDVVTEKFTSTTRNPATDGYFIRRYRPTTHAGFWPDEDKFDFPFLTVYPLHVLKYRDWLCGRPLPDVDDAIRGMGMMFSYAWCNSLAFYHGFSPYDELTYPFTTQNICTDGQIWNFSVYQMNTHAFHADLEHNGKSNICWTTGPLKLFDRIEDGKLVGINDSVIDLMLKFFVRQPSAQLPENVRPYLGEDLRTDEEKAEQEYRLKRYFGQAKSHVERMHHSNARPRYWEYIYGSRNKHAPSDVTFRKAPKYEWLQVRKRDKFTI